MIIAGGFSCREQISQETYRRALHLSQVLQMALGEGPNGLDHPLPENGYAEIERTAVLPLSVLAGTATVAGAGLWWARSRTQR